MPKKPSKYQYVRLPDRDVLKYAPTTIPPIRPFTDREMVAYRTRLQRVRMWEQFECTLYSNRDLNLQRLGPEKALQQAWKDTVRRYDRALCLAEERYREGLWKMDYPCLGKESDWTQDAVDAAISRLRKNLKAGKKPREDWDHWDDMQWVHAHLYDHLLRPDDFPTIEAYNYLAAARESDEDRREFLKKYHEIQKAIITKRENGRKETDEPDTSVPVPIPYEQTEGYRALQKLTSLFVPEAKND